MASSALIMIILLCNNHIINSYDDTTQTYRSDFYTISTNGKYIYNDSIFIIYTNSSLIGTNMIENACDALVNNTKSITWLGLTLLPVKNTMIEFFIIAIIILYGTAIIILIAIVSLLIVLYNSVNDNYNMIDAIKLINLHEINNGYNVIQ